MRKGQIDSYGLVARQALVHRICPSEGRLIPRHLPARLSCVLHAPRQAVTTAQVIGRRYTGVRSDRLATFVKHGCTSFLPGGVFAKKC